MTRKMIVALAMLFAGLMAPHIALAQSNPSWLAGKWGFNGDCTSSQALVFTMDTDGTLRFQDGSTGRWSVKGNQLVFDDGGKPEAFEFTKVNNDRLDVGGVAVTRCAPPLPPLTAQWLTGTRWSGRSDCGVLITFARGGKLTVSNGSTGSWSIAGGRIQMRVNDGPVLTLERRSDRQLIEVKGGSAFVRC